MMNSNTPLSMQKVWGWRVIWHLFLVDIAAGIYISGFILSLFYPQFSLLFMALAAFSALPLHIVGIILLISHLGAKTKVIRAFCHPESSWLSRGGIAMLLFLVLDLAYSGLLLRPLILGLPFSGLVLGAVTSLTALIVLLYSGMVLARLKSFPCWRSELLPLLFVISGLSGGLMIFVFLLLILGIATESSVREPLILAMQHTGYILPVQGIALGFYLWWAMSSPSTRDYARIIIRGSYSIPFWIGVVIAGILLPLGFGLLAHAQLSGLLIITFALELVVFGLVGALLLRYVVISAGVSSALSVEGNSVPLPQNVRVPASYLVRYR